MLRGCIPSTFQTNLSENSIITIHEIFIVSRIQHQSANFFLRLSPFTNCFTKTLILLFRERLALTLLQSVGLILEMIPANEKCIRPSARHLDPTYQSQPDFVILLS